MFKSSAEILRAYSLIIEDAMEMDQQENPEDFQPEGESEIGSVAGEDFSELDNSDSGDPVSDLSAAISNHIENSDRETIQKTIEDFLRQNKYELTPTNGLTNSSGEL